MPQHNIKLSTRQILLYLSLLLLVTVSTLCFYYFQNDGLRFRRFAEDLFASELAENTLSMHYTLANPDAYGIAYKPVLPVYVPGEEGSNEDIKESLSFLSDISRDKLTQNDAYTYDLLTRYLKKRLKSADFPYYSEPLSPSSGMQSGLPILLADYTFRSPKDIEDYLHLLDQTDEYFGGLLQYEAEKADKNLFMSNSAAADVIEQCSSIMDKDVLSSGEHFLHTTFTERLAALEKEGVISPDRKSYYESENDRLLTTIVQPSYEKIADSFTVLLNKGVNDMGLYHLPSGKEYYKYLLSSVTSSDRSIAEIKQLLFKDFQANYNQFHILMRQYPELASWMASNSLSFPLDSPEEMLNDLQVKMSKDFPGFAVDGQEFRPICTIKKVSDCMEAYSSPAYYLTPPIDDMKNNTIYINHRNSPDSLTLYTTLAHEGYPGHLYQTVYSQLYMNKEKTLDIRNLLHYGGYVEGWALYVENLSYYYAQSLVREADPIAAVYFESCRLNRNLQLCLYSLLDISIHYEGASMAQTGKILSTIGITNPSAVKNIYEYIVEEPAVYPKYYVGFLEFLNLKKEAEILWGSDFSLYYFHKFILETGPSDFEGLQQQLLALQ